MTLQSFQRFVVAKSNLVNPTDVTSVTATNFTTETGFPVSNLEYEDPWTICKSATVTGDPIIRHAFSTSVSPLVCGILNHNLGFDDNDLTKYATVLVESSPDDSIWTSRALVTIVGNSDILIPMTAANPSVQYWRVTFDGNNEPFFVGSIFWGTWQQFLTNQRDGGMIQVRRTPVVTETSAGGARHISFGANTRHGTLEISFPRAAMDDVSTWAQFPYYELIGILGPEISDYGDTGTLSAGEVFWGYVVDRTWTARGPGQINTGVPAKHDYTLFLEGAV